MVNNLLMSITNKVNEIATNVMNICDVIRKYDENTTVKNLSHFENVASEIDRIIAMHGNGVQYLSNYIPKENEVVFQVALHRSSGNPYFRVKLKSDRWYIKTNGGTYMMQNTPFETNNRFTLKDFSNSTEKPNEEGFKAINISIQSDNPIEEIYITSDVPIIAISGNLPSLKDYSIKNMINNTSHLRSVSFGNVKSANGLFEGCSRLANTSNVNLSNVYDFTNCFKDCTSLVEVYNLNLSNGNICQGMFDNCTSLQYISLDPNCIKVPNGLDFSSCSSMKLTQMMNFLNNLPFNGDGTLKTIYVPNIGMSSTQISSFTSRGYNIVVK